MLGVGDESMQIECANLRVLDVSYTRVKVEVLERITLSCPNLTQLAAIEARAVFENMPAVRVRDDDGSRDMKDKKGKEVVRGGGPERTLRLHCARATTLSVTGAQAGTFGTQTPTPVQK